MAEGHRLLVNERWLADWIRKQQDSGPGTPASLRMQAQYGPEGIRLIGAVIADSFTGAAIMAVAAIIETIFQHQQASAIAAPCLLIIGLGTCALGFMRARQASTAGKKHRANHPFKG